MLLQESPNILTVLPTLIWVYFRKVGLDLEVSTWWNFRGSCGNPMGMGALGLNRWEWEFCFF